MDFDTAVSRAWTYARRGNAVAWYLGFFGAWAALALVLAFVLMARFGTRLNAMSLMTNPAGWGLAVLGALTALVILLVGLLAINGTVIRNAANPAETMSESWKRVSPRIAALLGLLGLTTLASFTISLVFNGLAWAFPPAGLLFSGLHAVSAFALVLFIAFAEYALVLDGKSVFESLHHSFRLAREKPLDVFLAILLSAGTALLIVLCTVVLLIILAAVFVLLSATLRGAVMPLAAIGMVGGVILLAIGLFFAQTVKLHLMTQSFADLKGRKPERPGTQAVRPRATQKTQPDRKERPASRKPAIRTNATRRTRT